MQRIGSLGILLVGIAFLLILPIEVSATGITDTLEFEDTTMTRPQITHVAGDVYAIVSQVTDENPEVILVTVSITSTGEISDSVIAQFGVDGNVSSDSRPQIFQVDSDTFGIAYTENTGNDVLKTVSISADGTSISFQSSSETIVYDDQDLASHVQIAKVDSDTFAFVLRGDGEGRVITRNIDGDGNITTPPSNDSFSFDDGISGDPQIIELSTGHFAIVYEDTGDDGEIVTVDISSAGAITQSKIDGESQWSGDIATPEIIHIANDKYALLWQDSTGNQSPQLKTTTISSTGQITEASEGFPTIIDAFTFDTVAGSTPQITAVDENTFGVVWCTNDGNIAFRTIDISGTGDIASAITETLTITQTSGADNFPQILKISSTVLAVVYKDNSGSDGQLVTITIPAETTTTPKSSDGDTTAPTIGKSSTGRQVVENGFSYQSNLGGTFQTDADLGLTHMDSLKVAVGGMPPDPNAPPPVPPGEIPDDVREKLNERGLGDVANTFDNISDAINNLDNFFNRPPPADAPPGEAPPTPQEISDVLDNLKQGLDQSRVNPESHANPEQATQINNLLDKIAQKIAEIEGAI